MTANLSAHITITRNLAAPAANTSAAAGLLKILLAAQATGTAVQWAEADPSAPKSKQAYWVLLNDTQTKLCDANAVVRYLYKTGSLALGERLAVESALEWEEKTLSSLPAEDVGAILAAAERQAETLKAYASETAVATVLLGALYYALSNAKEAVVAKYPAVQKWYAQQLSSPSFSAALPAYLENVVKVLVREEPSLDNRRVSTGIAFEFDPSKTVLPEAGAKNVLITSALPYVNNVPHLGNVVGSTLSADAFARYSRVRGYNTLYICGTDEYGTATETKALEDGVTCQELCDKYHQVHKEVYEWFNLSFNYFGRTSTPKHAEIAQGVFRQCLENGYLIEKEVPQPYCEQCSRFLSDRYVEGTCPKCAYDDARGDQCDQCGTLLNAVELIDPRCKLDGSRPVIRDSVHRFIDLEKLQPQCEEFVRKSSEAGNWSSNSMAITNKWFTEGLKERCITRDLKWGVPVPLEGYESKVLYVWFEACIGYPSITANYTDAWELWWKNPSNVDLYQFMGKDNVPFHTVVFPSTQIASGDSWTQLHHIAACEYLNYESGKFSKSRGVGVFGNNARDTGVPPDVWRYFLMANRPESADAIFAWNDFVARNNGELLANVGNFCNRVVKFVDANTKYAGVLPAADPARIAVGADTSDRRLIDDVNVLLARYIEKMDAVKIKAGLRTAMEISARGNLYLQDSKLDNALFSENRAQCDTVAAVAINLIYLLSALFHPFMPATSANIARQLNAPERIITDTFELALHAGHVIGKADYLFTRIDEKMVDEWRARYGGKQDEAPAPPKPKKNRSNKPVAN
ncbi:methionine--tRNA ligase mes1 [Coemansia aciculifera]|uniref:Methionine--tRNA ligase mes1 n=1 Tax=Coemansia aciculifera TaxID=417176 RepID=A0ACC1M4Y8_9FUNG|nr:methionine--tRNA ligase mes1 [Coemansia aciculifera]